MKSFLKKKENKLVERTAKSTILGINKPISLFSMMNMAAFLINKKIVT
jgi:hypothetical protein